MTEQIISFFLSNIPLVMCALAIIIAALIPTNFNNRLFVCMLFFAVGISGIWEFAKHTFDLQFPFNNIGSEPSFVEFEMGLAYLGIGLGGIIAVFANWFYRAAIVTVTTTLLWGTGLWQIYQMVQHPGVINGDQNLALWTNILIPLILIILLIATYKKKTDELIYF